MSARAHDPAKSGPSRRLLALAVNLGAALIGLAGWAFWWADQREKAVPPVLQGDAASGFYEPVDDVGYLPQANRRVTARRIDKDRVIYDVVYSIGPHGFRLVPGGVATNPEACVLLLGDSNTFGEGLADGDTYAARLAARGGGRWTVHNFGVPGWAPHEALAGLQSGRFQRAAGCTPTHTIFFLINDHYRRIAGYAPWESHTPRYRLAADGRPVRDGNFDSDGPPVLQPPEDSQTWWQMLTTWNGWRRLAGASNQPSAAQAALMRGLMLEIARMQTAAAPGGRFDVLFWTDEDGEAVDGLAEALRRAGAGVHPVERIIPGYRAHWRDHLFSENDRHPTVATNDRIAAYVAREIMTR